MIGSEEVFSDEEIKQLMGKALQQAEEAFDADQIPVGCVFVNPQTKQIVAGSHNFTNITKNASRHCEINCIRQMKEKGVEIENMVLFVTVEPCIMCAHALNLVGIRQVYFGQFNDRFGGCGSVLPANQFIFRGGIRQEESLAILKSFYERGNQRLPQQMRNRSRKRAKNE